LIGTAVDNNKNRVASESSFYWELAATSSAMMSHLNPNEDNQPSSQSSTTVKQKRQAEQWRAVRGVGGKVELG
jgi:dipeptidase